MPARYGLEKWLEKFFSRLKADSVLGCWEWTGPLSRDGYGNIGGELNGATRTHRALFIALYGFLSEGICVLHRCDNRKCCNPFHLFTGTQSDNINDAVKKGRQPKAVGEKQWCAKLTESDVIKMRKIRKETGKRIADIAKDFGVATVTAGQAIRGYSWSHITNNK